MGHLKEVRVILHKTGLFKNSPGDQLIITHHDIASYRKVREALKILIDEIDGLHSSTPTEA